MRIPKGLGIAGLALSILLLAPPPALAEGDSAIKEFTLGTTCAAVNLIYGPVKVIYAVLGGVTGGLAWMLTGGNSRVARGILQPAVRGDYVVVPENLMGKKPLYFTGRDPRDEPYPY